MNAKQKKLLIRILASLACLILLRVFDSKIPFWGLKLVLYLVPYLIAGADILKKALHGIKNRQVFDENFLMAVATLGAFGVGIYNSLHGKKDDYTEAVSVMLFYQVGELFQSCAIGRSRKNISQLMDIRPDYANLEKDGQTVKVDPDEVPVGAVILINPGEKVPIDGIILEGRSSLNTAALTGESLPRDVEAGSQVLSGCINTSGLLRVQTTAEFGESTASKILDLVENAAANKSRSEAFISRFAHYYTPIVCGLALALAVLPGPILLLMGRDPEWATWIYRACLFLVISCPCALVISIPLSFFGGLGGASSQGILIKGSNYLELLSMVDTVVFDKTGTMTRGIFEVTGIHHSPYEAQKLLEYAAHLECRSSHPISVSLVKAYDGKLDPSRVSDLKEIAGEGVTARIDGVPCAAGSQKLMASLKIPVKDCHMAGAVVHMAVSGEYAGHILISDQVKDSASQAIRDLKAVGVSRCVMLTGDRENAAKQIASELGIDEVHSELLPADKVTQVERLLSSERGKGKLAFVGDGINDAPVLSRADIGIAMGGLGADAAIEAADVVLMDDDPRKIARAIKISKKCLRIVHQNIVFSLVIKIGCLILGAFGLANMWAAILSDVGVMILAVLNAIRTLFVKKL